MLEAWYYATVPLPHHCLQQPALGGILGKRKEARVTGAAVVLGTDKVEVISEVIPTEILQKLRNKLGPAFPQAKLFPRAMRKLTSQQVQVWFGFYSDNNGSTPFKGIGAPLANDC